MPGGEHLFHPGGTLKPCGLHHVQRSFSRPTASHVSNGPSLPAEAGAHGIVDLVQFIADLRNAVAHVGEQRVELLR
jgi:hypothetical protein